jgi:RND superfamily putative drug exporter
MSLTAMVALTAPVLGLRIGFADDSNGPARSTEHRAYDLLAAGFGKGFNGPLTLVVEPHPSIAGSTIAHIARAVGATPGVAGVEPAIVNPANDSAVLNVLPTTSPQDTAAAIASNPTLTVGPLLSNRAPGSKSARNRRPPHPRK